MASGTRHPTTTVGIEQTSMVYLNHNCLQTSPLEGENVEFDKMKVDKVMGSNAAATKLTMPSVKAPSNKTHEDDAQPEVLPITKPEPTQ
jgi:hypothetical protein